MSDRVTSPSADVLADRAAAADGTMGATLRSANPTLDDFAGHGGVTAVSTVTRPDAARTDKSPVTPTGQAEPGTGEKIFDLSRRGAELVREAADESGGRFAPGAVRPRAPSGRPARSGRAVAGEK